MSRHRRIDFPFLRSPSLWSSCSLSFVCRPRGQPGGQAEGVLLQLPSHEAGRQVGRVREDPTRVRARHRGLEREDPECRGVVQPSGPVPAQAGPGAAQVQAGAGGRPQGDHRDSGEAIAGDGRAGVGIGQGEQAAKETRWRKKKKVVFSTIIFNDFFPCSSKRTRL